MGDVRLSWRRHWSDDGKQSHSENKSPLERLAADKTTQFFFAFSSSHILQIHQELVKGSNNQTALSKENGREGLSARVLLEVSNLRFAKKKKDRKKNVQGAHI